jgi:exodeoxyribonuclease VII large subunit
VTAVDARTQGAGAALSMVRALHVLRRRAVDGVLLVRGGGARTDLVAFDGERLARTVAEMPVPVLAGVGHEIDTCVVDAVAHASYKTPTAAAAAVSDRVRRATDRAEAAWARVGPTVLAVPDRAERRLDAVTSRLRQVARAGLDRPGGRLDLLEAKVASHDPVRLLARGWSLTHTADGTLVRSPGDAPVGTELVTTVEGGTVRSTAT